MGKIFNLKEWLTVADAARHLSIVFGEEISEADVFQLGLDGHLRLSVYFVNGMTVQSGDEVRYDEAALKSAYASGQYPKELQWAELPSHIWMAELYPDWPIDENAKTTMSLWSPRIDEGRFWNPSGEVSCIEGVWDLPMIGAEKYQIKHLYFQGTDGTYVEPQNFNSTFLEGVFVQRGSEICQLQVHFESNECRYGSLASREGVEEYIEEKKLENDKAKRVLDEFNQARERLLGDMQDDVMKGYEPTKYFPEDAVIVVRTAALRELELSINGESNSQEKPMTTSERNSLLTIIAALCDYSAIGVKDRGTASQIAKLTDDIGAPVSDDTVRRVLAKINDALESRMK